MCRISHPFFRCCCRLSTFCTCPLRLAFVFQLCAGVGGGWGEGVMTSMRMRLVSSVSFFALLLKRCRLLCEALVAASCCFTFQSSTMQKPRVFEAFQAKTSQQNSKIINNKRRKNMVFATISTKRNQQTRPTNYGKTTPKHRLVDENHTKLRVFKLLTKKPPKNKRHTPRGGRRTCYLVVSVV